MPRWRGVCVRDTARRSDVLHTRRIRHNKVTSLRVGAFELARLIRELRSGDPETTARLRALIRK